MQENSLNQNQRNDTKEILLADYKYFCDSFWKNEETGETRVRFLVALVTAVLTALATLINVKLISVKGESKWDAEVFLTVIFSLFGLLAIGFITLFRLIKRNEVTDGYKRAMDEIRYRFKKYYDDEGFLLGYFPFKSEAKYDLPKRKIGGLTHTVAAINSLILSALGIVILYRIVILYPKFSSGYAISATILIFGVSFASQFFYLDLTDKKSKDLFKQYPFTHAGGIVMKIENNKPLYLIISATNKPDLWLFPKGHIKTDEDNGNPKKTATREVFEETGVEAEIIDEIGETSFMLDSKYNQVQFFLMRLKQVGTSKENRKMKWVDVEEGLEMLTFTGTKELLKRAHKKVLNYI